MKRVINFHREDAGILWGFQLTGGIDQEAPLTIKSVRANSLAAAENLSPGNRVLKIAGESTEKMTNLQAKQAVIRCSNDLELEIDNSNSAIPPQSRTIEQQAQSPSITESSESKFRAQKTSSISGRFAPMGFSAYTQLMSSERTSPKSKREETKSLGHQTHSASQSPSSTQTGSNVGSKPAPPSTHVLQEPAKSQGDGVAPLPPTATAGVGSGEPGIVMTVKEAETIPKCDVCHEKVSGVFVKIDSHCFCPDHFKCAECSKKLHQVKYGKHQGKFYCEEHYIDLVATKCTKCGKPINGTFVKALEKAFHPDCLVCSRCGITISESFHCEDSDTILCDEDWRKEHCHACGGCNQLITEIESTLEFLGKHYHSGCFRCTACRAPIPEGPCAVRNDKPYCSLHAKSSANIR